MGYVINLLIHTTIYKIYWSYSAYRSPYTGFICIPYILYYTMGYVMSLLRTYNYI